MPTSRRKKSTANPSPNKSPANSKRRVVDDVDGIISPGTTKRMKTASRTSKTSAIVYRNGDSSTSEKASIRKSPRKRQAQRYAESDEDCGSAIEEESLEVPSEAKSPKEKKAKARAGFEKEKIRAKKEQASGRRDSDPEESGDGHSAQETLKKRKRKTKEEKETEAMPLAARTTGIRMLVGAHVSIAKGVQNAVNNATHVGGNAFALFLKSQRKWENPALKNENRDAFRAECNTQGYDQAQHVLPHGSYLVNLAQSEPSKAKQAYDAFLDDLQRCEALGIKLYNFHPGAASGFPMPEAISRLAKQLNNALAATKTVIPVLENAAGSGTVIGSRFSDLRDIISQVEPKYRSRIGVCIDTCHAFAAGYDLRSPETYSSVWDEFDKTVGLKYLKALHLNDSKAPLDSKRDLHQNIGLGFLGLRAFHNVMNDPRFEGLPLILETPCEKPDPSDAKGKKTLEDKSVWAKEIKLLESLIGMDSKSSEFVRMEKELSAKGKTERDKMQKQIGEKNKKAQKKAEKGQKSLSDMMGLGIGKKSVVIENDIDNGVQAEEKTTLNFEGTNSEDAEELEETNIV